MSLELDSGIVSHSDLTRDGFDLDNEFPGSDRLFASPAGISVIAESLKQMASARYVERLLLKKTGFACIFN